MSPFTTLNAGLGGPLLLLCDHASRDLPGGYRRLGLPEDQFWRHIAWDIGAAVVTRKLAALLEAPAVFTNYSRLLIDCNRDIADPTLICAISDGTMVPGNHHIDVTEVAFRVSSYYQPYHEEISRLIREQAGVLRAIVAVHSFTPMMTGIERPWHVGVLWNKDGRLAEPLLRELAEDHTLVVGDNQPYSGRFSLGYTLNHHAEANGIPYALVEIRQDLIDTEESALRWAERLAPILRRALAQLVAKRPGPELQGHPRLMT